MTKIKIHKPRTRQNETERCVYCGKETEIPRSMPVHLRYGYVEGGGQLCRQCFESLIKPQKK